MTKLLCSDSFLSVLNQFSTSEKFWLAYSGGMDSSVLLHLFFSNKSKISQNIEVIYVNHGLEKEADDWGEFCKEQCKNYELPFNQLQITEACPKGVSVEAWARDKRYRLIEEKMVKDDVLFTAHHQDDQVETFFLQAFRGAGPRGLASMPEVKRKSHIFHVRPLLNYSREDLKHYAEENKLVWIDDKSNFDSRYDRNYFRHELVPVIQERWPAYKETISRLINNQKECKHLLDEIALEDLKIAQYKNIESLDLDAIKKLSFERQKNLVFYWLESLKLKIPGSKNIEKIISDVICSADDKAPCVNWADVEVRRYKNRLYASKAMSEINPDIEYEWNPENILNILDETLVAKSEKGKGISKQKVKNADFIVRYRQGGEKIHPGNCEHKKTVKQLFQERSVLPWLRDRVPLIYIDNKLAVIPGFCVDEQYMAKKDEPSWNISWSGYENVIQQ